MDPPTLLRDLHVSGTGGAQLLLIVTRTPEYRVRVRVNKSRRNHSARAIHTLGAWICALDIVGRADRRNARTIYRDSDVPTRTRIRHLRAAPSARRTGAGHNLRRVMKYDSSRHAVSAELGS